MLVSSRYPLSHPDPLRAIAIWIATCLLVFAVVDAIATRDVAIHVEEYRGAAMTDEQALSQAVQAAYAVEDNSWWIHDKSPYLVFDQRKTYQIAPDLYAAFNLEIAEDAFARPIALLKPRVASLTP